MGCAFIYWGRSLNSHTSRRHATELRRGRGDGFHHVHVCSGVAANATSENADWKFTRRADRR